MASSTPLDRALALANQGRFDAALRILDQAIAREPEDDAVARNLLSLSLCDPATTNADLRRRAEAVSSGRAQSFAAAPHPLPLRVGWLSGDLHHAHPVAANLAPVVGNMDRTAFQHFFYSDAPEGKTRNSIFRGLAAAWRETRGVPDGFVAEMIRQDVVDILVVIAGRFDQNRVRFGRQRAAPIQVSLHDPATSGAANIDYLVSDRCLTPRGVDRQFSERILRLPSFYIHQPFGHGPDPGAPPCAYGGPVTFGCFNNPIKISGSTMDLWGRLMAAMPSSRLVLKYQHAYESPVQRRRILEPMSARGVGRDRITLLSEVDDIPTHLAHYQRIDIALDPFPFSGSTTTFEALFMGVPVVTRPGETMVSRWSASMLRTLGLDAHIAGSDEAYVEIARGLAGDQPRLAELRRTLRERVIRSPLCDGPSRARQLGRLFQAIWRRHARQPVTP